MMLPNTKTLYVRAAVITICTSFLSLAARVFYVAASSPTVFPLIFGSLFVVIALYLWQLKAWARKATQFIIAVSLCLFIGGTFNPFYALGYSAAHGGESPDWLRLIAISVPFIALALWCYWVLDKFKNEFR